MRILPFLWTTSSSSSSLLLSPTSLEGRLAQKKACPLNLSGQSRRLPRSRIEKAKMRPRVREEEAQPSRCSLSFVALVWLGPRTVVVGWRRMPGPGSVRRRRRLAVSFWANRAAAARPKCRKHGEAVSAWLRCDRALLFLCCRRCSSSSR